MQKFTKETQNILRLISLVIRYADCSRNYPEHQEDYLELRSIVEPYPDFCSASCGGDQERYLIEVSRQALSLLERKFPELRDLSPTTHGVTQTC